VDRAAALVDQAEGREVVADLAAAAVVAAAAAVAVEAAVVAGVDLAVGAEAPRKPAVSIT
jgi:hypothetical protein